VPQLLLLELVVLLALQQAVMVPQAAQVVLRQLVLHHNQPQAQQELELLLQAVAEAVLVLLGQGQAQAELVHRVEVVVVILIMVITLLVEQPLATVAQEEHLEAVVRLATTRL
jgi:hypothetical protein